MAEPDGESNGSREPEAMDFWDHVEELRRALLHSLLGIGLGIVLVAFFFVQVFSWLRRPLDLAMAAEGGSGFHVLTTTHVMGVFSVLIQVCMIGGIAVGLPFVLYNLARFVGPGLTSKEKAVLTPACLATVLLFSLGAIFAFFVILPAALRFTLYFNQLLGLETIWTAQSYYGFVAWTMIGIGLAFEFPLVVVILQYLGVVTPQQLRDGRRYAILLITIAAALLTPGDPFSLFFLAIPMLCFYEVAILIGDRLNRRSKRDWDTLD